MILLIAFFITGLTTQIFASEFSPKNIYEKTSNAVVLVTAAELNSKLYSLGTGTIIREDGLVITNSHVVYNEKFDKIYENINIYLKPRRVSGNIKKDAKRKYKVSIVHYSKLLDLALLKVDNISLLPKLNTINFSNSDNIEIGDPVIAIGHPEQGSLWTLTTGTISSQLDDFQNVIGKNVFQTETSFNKGNSGGPLINANGDMIGINSNIAREGKNGAFITSINFSIKSNVAIKWLENFGIVFSSIANVVQSPVGKQTKILTPKILPIPKKPKVVVVPTKEHFKNITKPRKNKNKLTIDSPFKNVEDEMEVLIKRMKKKTRKKTFFE